MSNGPNQDPHKTAAFSEKELEAAIGRQVRRLRQLKGQTIAQLAKEMGLSNGMLSKIENGQISPSLSSLQALSKSLNVPITTFFEGFEEQRLVMHVKAGEGVEMARAGTRAGHHYTALGNIVNVSSGVIVEPYLISLTTSSDVFPTFQHAGMEFLYMIEGTVGYRHGQDVYMLEPGDSLFFDADAPHGPERLEKLPAKYLSIICYSQES